MLTRSHCRTQPLIVYDDEIQPMAPDRPTRFLD
jgi:hypothetical protein